MCTALIHTHRHTHTHAHSLRHKKHKCTDEQIARVSWAHPHTHLHSQTHTFTHKVVVLVYGWRQSNNSRINYGFITNLSSSCPPLTAASSHQLSVVKCAPSLPSSFFGSSVFCFLSHAEILLDNSHSRSSFLLSWCEFLPPSLRTSSVSQKEDNSITEKERNTKFFLPSCEYNSPKWNIK